MSDSDQNEESDSDSPKENRGRRGTVYLENATVEWKDDDIAIADGIPVHLLPNGWIYTPKTDCYYPPTEVVEVDGNDG